jgi:alkylated DNA repair dioxygenase AlkB
MEHIKTRRVETPQSFLDTYKIVDEETFENLIKECIKETDDKLLVNPQIRVFNKPATQHRSIGFFSNESIGYYYSRQLAKSIPLTENTANLLEMVNTMFGADFNGILVNKYNGGSDYIGAHSDDESNLSFIGVVAISYGSIRNFRIRDKNTRKIVDNIPTLPCQLIHMGGDFQTEFLHEIPIQKKIKGIRYSFTFRHHKS